MYGVLELERAWYIWALSLIKSSGFDKGAKYVWPRPIFKLFPVLVNPAELW